MARIHTDLHFISADYIPQALKVLFDAGLITRSERDIRFSDIRTVKMQYPECGAFVEVISKY